MRDAPIIIIMHIYPTISRPTKKIKDTHPRPPQPDLAFSSLVVWFVAQPPDETRRYFCFFSAASHQTNPTTTGQDQASRHHRHRHHRLQHTRRASSSAIDTPRLIAIMRADIVALVALGLVSGASAAAPTFSCFNPPDEGQTTPLGEGNEDLVESACCEELTDER